jgi:hypothetical protein
MPFIFDTLFVKIDANEAPRLHDLYLKPAQVKFPLFLKTYNQVLCEQKDLPFLFQN